VAIDRIAVTGAAGFVGRNVVRRLAAQGDSIVAIVRPEDEIPVEFPAEVRALDVGDEAVFRTAIGDVSRVVHLAARSGGIQLQQATHLDLFSENRSLSNSVLRAARSTGIDRVFLASSTVVYRDSVSDVIDESGPILGPADRPTGYAWSKVCDEVVAGWVNQSGGTETAIGRFGNVYGPEASFDPTRSTVVHALIARIVDAPEGATVSVWGDGSAVRSFIYVTDVAEAVRLIVEDGEPGGVYNVDTTEPIAIRDLAGLIRDLASPSVRLEFDPMRPSGVAVRVPDNTRLRSLGFTPSVTLVDGLKSTIDWYRTHHDGF
jgi:nucleoside-diphosphate-sugar epimerase